jgi:hypothetical protein
MSLTEEEGRDAQAEQSAVTKRPYAAPELRLLGSVAELTLGDTGSVTDGPASTKVSG